MAHKRQDTLTAPRQWWKHLRDWKQFQNKAERQASKKLIQKDVNTSGEK